MGGRAAVCLLWGHERGRYNVFMASSPVQFISLFDTAEAPLLVTDPEGRTLYANACVSRRTGYSQREIIGRTPGELWGGHMPRAFYRQLWRTLKIERRPFFGTVKNHGKQRGVYSEDLALAPILNPSGRPVYYMALHRTESAMSLQRFQAEIVSIFSPERCTVRELVRGLRRWYMTDTEKLSWGEASSPEAFLRTWFVLPMETFFGERAEDQELLRAVRDDPTRFDVLYAKYSPKIYQYFLRHLSDRNRAEDCMQETFFRAFQALPKYEFKHATYGTFLLRIAHNLLVNSYRHEDWLPLDAAADPESAAPSTDLSWVWDAPQLTRLERRALELYYRRGYAIREVAERLDRSENAIKLLLSRARRKLRRLVS